MTDTAHHILMLSSSRMGDEQYLEHAQPMIQAHLGDCRDVLFIPYAGVTLGWDDYVEKVQQALPSLKVTGIHTADENPPARLWWAVATRLICFTSCTTTTCWM